MDIVGSLRGEMFHVSPPPPFNLAGGGHLAAYTESVIIEGYRCIPIKEKD
jgi:hypothetical protein